MATSPLELRLVGTGVTPENLDVSYVLNLLKAYRDAVVAAGAAAGTVSADQPAVALVGIEPGSCRYRIRLAATLRPAAIAVSQAVIEQNFDSLPPIARRELRSLIADLKQSGHTLELPGRRQQTASLTGATVIPKREAESYTGQTTLYGEVRLTGGGTELQGRAELILHDGTIVKLFGSRDMIKRLANNLYEEVGVDGAAVWDSSTNVPFELRVDAIRELPQGGIAAAFSRMADAAGTHWDDVDASAFVTSLRSE